VQRKIAIARKFNYWMVIKYLISFGGVILIWKITSDISPWPEMFYPGPEKVWESFEQLTYKGMLPIYVSLSLKSLFLGSIIAILSGIITGFVIGINRKIYLMFSPLILFFQSIAEIAWLPLLVLWFGFGLITILIVVWLTVFFPTVFNTMLGVRRVPDYLVNGVLTLSAKPKDVFLDVLLPGSLPNIISGMRMGIGYGWRALIAAEMITGNGGLGFMIFDARRFGLTSNIIVGMIIIGISAITIDTLILKPLEIVTIEKWGIVRKIS